MPSTVFAVSPAQVTFFLTYIWVLKIWLVSEYFRRTRKSSHSHFDDESKGAGDVEAVHKEAKQPPSPISTESNVWSHSIVRCLQLNHDALVEHNETLRQMAEFGSWIVWYYLCDRTHFFSEAEKNYSRDLFLFLFAVLTAVAFGTSLQTIKAPLLLNRQQTEEWKGWMQVLFLLYHYYDAREAYNAIRIFIAAYVWMTGYGNFSYYVKTNDFCVGRFTQMMWRLNFLVFFLCVALQNSYMLYYICPMHTLFTIFVYGALAIGWQLNQSTRWLLVKLLICLALIVLLWNKTVFYLMWSPFTWLVQYNDPRKPSDDIMHEWFFRSGLDRFIWIYGMLCAMLHAPASAVLIWIDNLPIVRRLAMRITIVTTTLVCSWIYFLNIYCRDKYSYNQIHPYTSWIPITLFIILRNMTPSLRLHHLRLYGWLGCITLETYLGQFHIWMRSNLPDGQPKALLSLIPGMPLLNFMLVTAGYVFVSHRLFELTNTLKNVAVPHDNKPQLLRNIITMIATGAVLYCSVWGTMVMYQG